MNKFDVLAECRYTRRYWGQVFEEVSVHDTIAKELKTGSYWQEQRAQYETQRGLEWAE